MHTMNQTLASSAYGKTTSMTRCIVVALVVAAHFLVFLAWSQSHNDNVVVAHEMAMSFEIFSPTLRPATSQPRQFTPALLPLPDQVAEQSAPVVEQQQAAVVAPTSVAAAVVAIPDTEPDYKATYLNNPSPTYPMVARRMGLQGRVVLNVEVLADGVCGEINIQKSSGYAMLDNAALQTVKSWRFMPARQAGHTVDKWFMIPIQFSLRDNAA